MTESDLQDLDEGMFRGLSLRRDEITRRLQEIDTQLLIGKRIRALWSNEAFRQLLNDCAERVREETKQLVQRPHNAYQLGLRQGYLRALNVFASVTPMDDKELAALEAQRTPLLTQQEELTNVLT